MPKLKLQYFGHLVRRADKIEGRRRRGRQRMRWFTDSMDMSLSKLWEIGEDREAFASHGVTKSQTQLSD